MFRVLNLCLRQFGFSRHAKCDPKGPDADLIAMLELFWLRETVTAQERSVIASEVFENDERLGDDNPRMMPDAAWAPLITTPCFPSYGSNHAAGSSGGGPGAGSAAAR